jgi:peptidoglycan/xylan/chitin deacetylase (PgdA/CDA1 family)
VYRPLVLCYHAVSSTWPASLAVSEQALGDQLELLHRRRYVGLTFAEAERRRQDGSLPRRTVVVTFDDGYRSTLRAVPVLERFGFPGTVFVVSGWVGSAEPMRWHGVDEWAEGAYRHELVSLTWDELAGLRARGWEVGSHTVTHPALLDLSDAALATELETSRAAISERLGACETIAYPYGKADRRVADAARAAGYVAACTLTTVHDVDEPFLRPRAGIYPTDTGWRARVKLSSAFAAARRSRLGPLLGRLAQD